MKNIIEYIIFRAFSKLAHFLGLKFSRKFSKFIALFFFYVVPIRKKTVIENLTIAFPEFSEKKIKNIAFKSYQSFAIVLMEIFYMPYINKVEMEKTCTINNREIIFEKQREDRGVIILSAHYGNWEYGAAFVPVLIGQPFTVMVKAQRNPYVTKYMNAARTRWINKIVMLGVSIRQVYKALIDKNVVAMIADQRGPADGTRVNFFGRSTAIYSGPAVLALKTNSPLLCGVTERQADYSYKMEIVEIDLTNLPDDENEKITEVCQRYISYLEGAIRKNPEQWLWMHKIWKH